MNTGALADVALRWAGEHVAYASAEEIQSRPWGQTLRLSAGEETFYLKRLARCRTTECVVGPVLSRLFPDQAPSVVAADPVLGFILSRDHRGQALLGEPSERDLSDLLTEYAKLQARAQRVPDLLAALPTIRPTSLVGRMRDFLGSSARYWLTDAEVGGFAATLEARADWMLGLLARTLALPRTINHGDLHFGNVAVRSAIEGPRFVLYDWNDASAGPAGTSLGFAYGSLASILDDIESRTSRPLEDYVQTLSEEGYATTDALWYALPGAALAGTLRAIMDFGLYPDPDPVSWADTRERTLSSLAGLCEAVGRSYAE